MSYEPEAPDAELEPEEAAALEELLRAPELGEAAWAELRRNVASAAAMPLARRRQVRARRRTARWIAPLLPVAAAAAVVLMLGRDTTPAVPMPAEDALIADVTDEEFRALVSGEADPRALLLMAVGED